MRRKDYRQRAKRNDRIASWVITGGGVAIIAAVILILLLIVRVTLPLFTRPAVQLAADIAVEQNDAASAVAAGVDEYLATVYVVRSDGTCEFYDAKTSGVLAKETLRAPGPRATAITAADAFGANAYCLTWNDGAVSLVKLAFASQSNAPGNRAAAPGVNEEAAIPPPAGKTVLLASARPIPDGGTIRAAYCSDGAMEVLWHVTSEDLFGNISTSEQTVVIPAEAGRAVFTALVLDGAGEMLYAGTADGRVQRWDVSEPGAAELLDDAIAQQDGAAITALSLVFGDESLAVGDETGGLSTWFPAPAYPGAGRKGLSRIHTLASHASAVRTILPSLRNKGLLSLDESGRIHFDHMTSERHLLNLTLDRPMRLLGFSPRANGFAGLTSEARLLLWQMSCPHPEVSWRTLFGKVHYEGYDAPAWVWQSSASNDDFEPKMSLTPLIFGSLKGTLYAMLYAIPLALFAAVYTSYFTSPGIRAVVKPVVEIMAAIPSVVIGFLAALWLAPVVEDFIVPFLASVLVLPAALLLFVLVWQPLRRSAFAQRVERGYEFLVLIPFLLLAAVLAYYAGGLLESRVFGGDFQQWLFNTAGERYDQRNSIIIAFALGFAVIPIIFTIAEDALSNVPYSLKAASLALGATRWQTVWRVVLPSASPGIFAGIMIGFGRAVGETMIVLMATGNTPIMDPSIFNGMRTLSANIAVEIPEAPLNGTLYRVLFLSAIILFALTSTANTAAELVRQRLRKKYGQF